MIDRDTESAPKSNSLKGALAAAFLVMVASLAVIEADSHRFAGDIKTDINSFSHGMCVPGKRYVITGAHAYQVAGPDGKVYVALIGTDGGVNAEVTALPLGFQNGGAYTFEGACNASNPAIPLDDGILIPSIDTPASLTDSSRTQQAIERVMARTSN